MRWGLEEVLRAIVEGDVHLLGVKVEDRFSRHLHTHDCYSLCIFYNNSDINFFLKEISKTFKNKIFFSYSTFLSNILLTFSFHKTCKTILKCTFFPDFSILLYWKTFRFLKNCSNFKFLPRKIHPCYYPIIINKYYKVFILRIR